MELNKLTELNEKRRALRRLLSPGDPGDALASYYALWHDPRRTEITLHYDTQQRVDGFVTVCQTGADLFRPLVALRAPDEAAAGELLRAALAPNRPYQIIVPVMLASAMRSHLEISQATLNRIYVLDPARFQPVINVLVQQVTGVDGANRSTKDRRTPAASTALRFQIESQGQVMAMSGTNWRSPDFAEVFVYVHPRGRGRGWGKSVVSACTAALLAEGQRPLYMVEEENKASIRIAESLGYTETGDHALVAEGKLE